MNTTDLHALTNQLIELRNDVAAERFGPDCLREYYDGQARAYEQALYALYAFSGGEYGIDFFDGLGPARPGRVLCSAPKQAAP